MEYQLLLFNLCDLFVVDANCVDDDDLAKLVMELGIPSIPNIHLVKDRGNSLFREGDFSLAARHYTRALKLVCFLGLPPVHDQPIATSLCLSLVLNLAGCELKLSQYNRACCYCSFVLSFDPSNVKALYRRGLAFKHLNLLNKALDDFELALKFDPHNKDVNREFHSMADLLVFNANGKRVAYPFNPLGSDKKGKKPLIANDVVDKFPIHADLNEASCSTAPAPLVTDHISPPHAAVTSSSAVLFDCEYPNASGSDIIMDSEILFAATDPVISLKSDSLNEAAPALSPTDDCNPSNTCTSKPGKYSFTNKNHPKNDLRLSSQDYENLLLGKNLLFYHPRSLSSLRVRPLNSTNFISTGTPHEDISREAAIPIPYPSLEVHHHHSQLGSVSESDELGHEEAVFHIDKKKRLSCDSSMVSKVSEIQFEFVAVKKNSSRKCCRKMEHSIHRGRMVRSDANSRKRSLGCVDKLPLVFCRYRGKQRKAAAVECAKRKEVDLLPFEDYYHPPFKKYRLSISVSSACNFSSVSSACNFSSVTSVSGHLGVSYSPMFVW